MQTEIQHFVALQQPRSRVALDKTNRTLWSRFLQRGIIKKEGKFEHDELFRPGSTQPAQQEPQQVGAVTVGEERQQVGPIDCCAMPALRNYGRGAQVLAWDTDTLKHPSAFGSRTCISTLGRTNSNGTENKDDASAEYIGFWQSRIRTLIFWFGMLVYFTWSFFIFTFFWFHYYFPLVLIVMSWEIPRGRFTRPASGQNC